MRRNALPPDDIQHMKFKASASFFADSGVVTFREGWRPVVHGTPTLTEWPVPFWIKIILKSNDFERRSRWKQVAGSGPDPKIIDFDLKSF